jgi:hypothetical protein
MELSKDDLDDRRSIQRKEESSPQSSAFPSGKSQKQVQQKQI